MTKTTTITDTAVAIDACRQLNLTGLAPSLDELFTDAARRRVSHPPPGPGGSVLVQAE